MQTIQWQKMPDKPVSFVGNAALVLIVVFLICAGSAAAVVIYDVLADTCLLGCP